MKMIQKSSARVVGLVSKHSEYFSCNKSGSWLAGLCVYEFF